MSTRKKNKRPLEKEEKEEKLSTTTTTTTTEAEATPIVEASTSTTSTPPEKAHPSKKQKIDKTLESLLFHWEWFDNDSGTWTPYSKEMNEDFNKAFNDHVDPFTFKRKDENYKVDFKKLQQINTRTKFARAIRRTKFSDGSNSINPFVVFSRKYAKAISHLAVELKCTTDHGFEGNGTTKIAGAVWKMLKSFDEEIDTFNTTAKDDEKKARIKVLEDCNTEAETAQERWKNITQHKKDTQTEFEKKQKVLEETEKKNKETREALEKAEAALLKGTAEKNYSELPNLANKVSELGAGALVLDQEVTQSKTELEELESVLKFLS